MKIKSERNKTIDFSLQDGEKYLTETCDIEKVESLPLNTVCVGDTFNGLKKIKYKSVE